MANREGNQSLDHRFHHYELPIPEATRRMATSHTSPSNRPAHDLALLTERSSEAGGVRRGDVRPGDVVMVKTRNSVYAVRFVDGGTYSVSGGWFDQQFGKPIQTTIAGCTWGGSVLQRDLVAACGMHLEFGNRVVTSAIQMVCHFRGQTLN